MWTHRSGCPSCPGGCSTSEYQQLGSACCSTASPPESCEKTRHYYVITQLCSCSALRVRLLIQGQYSPPFTSWKPTIGRLKFRLVVLLVPISASNPTFHIHQHLVISINLQLTQLSQVECEHMKQNKQQLWSCKVMIMHNSTHQWSKPNHRHRRSALALKATLL